MRLGVASEYDCPKMSIKEGAGANAIDVFSVATGQRLRSGSSIPPLNLRLGARFPDICARVGPMIVKVPVISLRWFLDLHVAFTLPAPAVTLNPGRRATTQPPRRDRRWSARIIRRHDNYPEIFRLHAKA